MLRLYLGTVMTGGIFLPLNTAYTGADLACLITDAEPHIVVCDPEAETAIAALCPAGITLLTLGPYSKGSLTDVARGQSAVTLRGPNYLTASLYTSGTTGRPTGAIPSNANLTSTPRHHARSGASRR